MSICIMWERPDGGITVEMPAYADKRRSPDQSDEDLLAELETRSAVRLAKKYGGVSISHRMDDATIPKVDSAADSFRDAWEWQNGVSVNMSKARIIHMNRIRQARDAELTKLDTSFMRAVEVGDATEQARISQLKQTLRDIPQTFDLASLTTPETLKAAWPPEVPA